MVTLFKAFDCVCHKIYCGRTNENKKNSYYPSFIRKVMTLPLTYRNLYPATLMCRLCRGCLLLWQNFLYVGLDRSGYYTIHVGPASDVP